MKGSEDSHLEKNGQIDISLLKEMLTNNNKPSREWTKSLIKRFISIVSNYDPNQRMNPTFFAYTNQWSSSATFTDSFTICSRL